MVLFKPRGWEEGNLPLEVISRFSIEDRKIVICSYGFMYGVFDFVTGGKICDVNIVGHPLYTEKEWIKILIDQAKQTLDFNPGWLDVLNKLPVIN